MLLFAGCSRSAPLPSPSATAPAVVSPSSVVKTAEPIPEETERATPEPSPSPTAAPDPILIKLNSLSLDEKIGQLVLVGFDGYTVDEQLSKLITDYYVTGVIVYSANVEGSKQLTDLTNSIKAKNKANKIPLLITADEEGGSVSRMPAELVDIPSNRAIGNYDNPQLCFNIGSVIAAELSAFGFNLDFAPVMDIFSNPQNTVIGDRSFGSSAELVSRLGVSELKGIKSGGIIPVVKHFPGHGDTVVDSHYGLPSVTKTLDELRGLELLPFQSAIDDGADALMVAHILMTAIDPANPASMSKAVVSGILRDTLGFHGVVFTDDLTMGAIINNFQIGEAAVSSIEAGCDIAAVCHGYYNAVLALEALRSAVSSGAISEARLDESVYRILALKDKYGISDEPVGYADISELNNAISKALPQ